MAPPVQENDSAQCGGSARRKRADASSGATEVRVCGDGPQGASLLDVDEANVDAQLRLRPGLERLDGAGRGDPARLPGGRFEWRPGAIAVVRRSHWIRYWLHAPPGLWRLLDLLRHVRLPDRGLEEPPVLGAVLSGLTASNGRCRCSNGRCGSASANPYRAGHPDDGCLRCRTGRGGIPVPELTNPFRRDVDIVTSESTMTAGSHHFLAFHQSGLTARA